MSNRFDGRPEIERRISSLKGMTAELNDALLANKPGFSEVDVSNARVMAEANLCMVDLLFGIHEELVKLNEKPTKGKKSKTLYDGQ